MGDVQLPGVGLGVVDNAVLTMFEAKLRADFQSLDDPYPSYPCQWYQDVLPGQLLRRWRIPCQNPTTPRAQSRTSVASGNKRRIWVPRRLPQHGALLLQPIHHPRAI